MTDKPEIIKEGLLGYWGQFVQSPKGNSTSRNEVILALIEMGDFYEKKVKNESWSENDKELRFAAIDSPPHSFVEINGAQCTVWGPMFTLFVETAKFLNFSLKGVGLDAATNPWPTFAKSKPDFFVAPLWPHMQLFQYLVTDLFKTNMLEMMKTLVGVNNVGSIAAFLGSVDLDYVLYQKKWEARSPFTFMTIFDTGVWFLLFVIPIVCALISSVKVVRPRRDVRNYFPYNRLFWKVQKIRKILKEPSFFERLMKNNFFFFASLLNSLPIKRYRFSVRFLVNFWLFTVLVFVQFYTGEMFSEMTRSDNLKVIDSWQDLHRADSVRIVAQSPEIAYKPGQENNYFNQELEIAKGLANRLDLIGFRQFYEDDFIENLTRSLVDDSKTAFMASNALLYYTLHHVDDGRHVDDLHVSASGGYAQPYFMTSMFVATSKKKKVLKFVSERLIEAGIYQKLFETTLFGLKPFVKKSNLLASFESAEFRHFKGVCYLAAICFLISIFSLGVEAIFVELLNYKK